MKTDQISISINRFLTNYLGVKLDYSKKKWTHARLHEVLVEYNMEDCIVKSHADIEQLYSGDIVAVIDQVGKTKFYKNPIRKELFAPTDSFCINYEINKKRDELNELYRIRVNNLSEVSILFKKINDLYLDIDSLNSYLNLVKIEEEKENIERLKYKKKIKRRCYYDKHKRR